MVSWHEFAAAQPGFAERVRTTLDAHLHKTVATLRADGSPRISGIEARLDGEELTFGSMPGSRKSSDLARDPRFALHSATTDPPQAQPATWMGEAKVAGRAVPTGPLVDGPPGTAYRADLAEVVWTGLSDDGTRLRIESWHPATGWRVVERG